MCNIIYYLRNFITSIWYYILGICIDYIDFPKLHHKCKKKIGKVTGGIRQPYVLISVLASCHRHHSIYRNPQDHEPGIWYKLIYLYTLVKSREYYIIICDIRIYTYICVYTAIGSTNLYGIYSGHVCQ